MPTPPRIILYDLFGTLVDVRGGLESDGRRIAGADAVRIDWHGLIGEWIRSYGRVMTSGQPWRPLCTILAESLREIAPRFVGDAMDAGQVEQFAGAWGRLPLWPDAKVGMDRIRAASGIKQAAFTNASVPILDDLASRNGDPWDVLLSADDASAFKPDPAIYRMALDYAGCPPDQVMLAAAHCFDLNAANRLGIRTALITRTGEPGSDPSGLDHDAELIVPNVERFADAMGA